MSSGIIIACLPLQDTDCTGVVDDIAIMLARKDVKDLKVLVVDWTLRPRTSVRHFTQYASIPANARGLQDILYCANLGTPLDYREALTQIGRLRIDFLGSGQVLQPVDWHAFYHDNGGSDFIESLRQQWRRDYDVTLINAGAGWGDSQGACLIQLADVAVIILTDHTDLRGVPSLAHSVQEARQRLAHERMPLRILPLPLQSLDNPTTAAVKLADMARAASDCFKDWLPQSLRPLDVLRRIRLDSRSYDSKLGSAASRHNVLALDRVARFLASDCKDLATLAGMEAAEALRKHLPAASAAARVRYTSSPPHFLAKTSNPGAMSVLRGNPIFRELPEDLLTEVAALCENRRYERNQPVFEEGTPGTKLYGVIAGRLWISTSSPEGREFHLNVAEPGDIVGEIAFLDGDMRTATARAAESTTCFEIEREPFFKFLERKPVLGMHLLQLVTRRVRWMTRLVADSVFCSVEQRLATRMLYLGKLLGDGTKGVEIRISQAELAEFLGISRQVVNSYLSKWRRDGLVTLGRGKIVIHDPVQLLLSLKLSNDEPDAVQ
jgi:CRP-like cAMP-binding protein